MIMKNCKQCISVVGSPISLNLIEKSRLKGINADMLLNITFYDTIFNGERLCLIKIKDEKRYTPLKYRRLTQQIEEIVNIPVILLLNSLEYHGRERLISQGVYFIISDKYAFLPTLVMNVRSKRKTKKTAKLTPAAQYVLLHYLLHEKNNVFTIVELETLIPYNYLAIARAVVILEELELCKVEIYQSGTKHIQFDISKKTLWSKAQAYLFSPIKKTVYSDDTPNENLATSGVNALSYYSCLNPEQYGSVAVWDRDFDRYIKKYNEIEGLYTIEVWKYPVSIPYKKGGYVDKLSLYLSLKNNPDPRIEKELEIILEELEKW